MFDHSGYRKPNVPELVGLTLAIVGIVSIAALGTATGDVLEMSQSEVFLLWFVGWWVLVGSIIALVRYWEDRPLSSIGIRRPTARTVVLGIGGFLVGFVTFVFTTPLVAMLGLETAQSGVSALTDLPAWVLFTAALTGTVVEELLFRGYLLERVGELTGNLWVGALVSGVCFSLIFYPIGGLGMVLQIGVWTVVVTAVYLNTRNLSAPLLMHGIHDFYAFFLVPVVLS